MADKYEIVAHRLHVNGSPVPFKQTPNQSGKITPEAIVMHDTASGLSADGPISWLCDTRAKASAHFVLGRDGKITQLAYTNRKTWHAGKSSLHGRRNVNNFAIGIEMVSPGWLTSKDGGKTATFSRGSPTWDAKQYGIHQITDDGHPGHYYWMSYTDEQIEAAFGMCAALKDYYSTIKEVTGHFIISPGRKVDPNPLFPLQRLNDYTIRNRGPVNLDKPAMPKAPDYDNTPPAEGKEVDENNDFDAVTTTNLNIRPWPDSPNRFGTIKVGSPVDIVRQSVSQKDGATWYFVEVAKGHVMSRDGGKPDSDDKYRGFVHGSFLRMVD